MRERGLKCRVNKNGQVESSCRSREGAWIEMALMCTTSSSNVRRSREGAWIEISVLLLAG